MPRNDFQGYPSPKGALPSPLSPTMLKIEARPRALTRMQL